MPRERSRNNSSDAFFLNCDLDKQLKKDLVAWCAQQENLDVFNLFEKIVDSGIKIGMSYDAFNECMQCSLSKPITEGGKTKTYILVGRGGSLVQAIQAVLFKHFIMLEGTWEDLDRKNTRKETDWA